METYFIPTLTRVKTIIKNWSVFQRPAQLLHYITQQKNTCMHMSKRKNSWFHNKLLVALVKDLSLHKDKVDKCPCPRQHTVHTPTDTHTAAKMCKSFFDQVVLTDRLFNDKQMHFFYVLSTRQQTTESWLPLETQLGSNKHADGGTHIHTPPSHHWVGPLHVTVNGRHQQSVFLNLWPFEQKKQPDKTDKNVRCFCDFAP